MSRETKKRHKADAYGAFLRKRGAKITVKTPFIPVEYRFLGGVPVLFPSDEDVFFMKAALLQAGIAAGRGEVPVGCVIARGGRIVASAYNRRETGKSALAHAELLAIGDACAALGGWRLHQCDLYVTLEPCPMCMGAIINARIRRVVFGAWDPKAGCLGSVADFNAMPFNHHPEVVSGVCAEESRQILQDFFAALRAGKAPPPA